MHRYLLAAALLAPSFALQADDKKPAPPRYKTESVQGKVVWLGDALKRKFGVNVVPEAQQRVLALETAGGQLHPLIEDLRGRAFRKDKRLRDMTVELLVRRYNGSPALQVIRMYEIKKDGKHQVDYWCDVCSIVMFEDGPCDCCQDHNRLRWRKVKP